MKSIIFSNSTFLYISSYWKISIYLYTWHWYPSERVPHYNKDNFFRQQFPSYVYISKFIWNGFSTAAAPHEIEDIKCLCEYLFRCWREFDAINQAITWRKIGLLCLSLFLSAALNFRQWKEANREFIYYERDRSLSFTGSKKSTHHQWFREISILTNLRCLRKSALKFTKGRKRENSISYHFLLF